MKYLTFLLVALTVVTAANAATVPIVNVANLPVVNAVTIPAPGPGGGYTLTTPGIHAKACSKTPTHL